jgi:hypothetical protein
MVTLEIASFMGKDITAKSLENVIYKRYKQVSKLQQAARDAGEDPGLVNYEVTWSAGDAKKGQSKDTLSHQ